MKIHNLGLVNFRNYSKLSLTFGPNMNVFVGDNGTGKTNILEAITILALTKSHRVGVSPNIIMFLKDKCKISGSIKKNKVTTKLNVEITEDTKKLSVNNTIIRKVSDYISNLNVIVFTPDDLEIIKGSPNVRRNLLNIQLCQLSKEYLKTYNEYNKLLKTRNEYLKILLIRQFLFIKREKNILILLIFILINILKIYLRMMDYRFNILQMCNLMIMNMKQFVRN